MANEVYDFLMKRQGEFAYACPRDPKVLDAIHLAACDISQEFPLCATDSRMRAAATKLGIPLFPEALPS